jgi:hypothetical protein
VVAQNNVETNANVAVKVGGQNFAPITVVINSIAQIFNWGVASATSGDAVANGSPTSSGSAGATAASGSSQANGAQVANSVDLRSSAAVHVTGNNYSPINILLNMAANLVNWGVATATSGDALASGSGGGSASSGAASATGLRAVNLVSMWADASVDIEGNNYAPIFILINFNTNVANVGYAGATSGNVASGQSSSTVAGASGSGSSGASGASGSSSSSGGTSSSARGGDAVAVSNSVDVASASNQIATANGGKSITTTAVAQMLRDLPSGTWTPFVRQNMPDTVTPAVVAGMSSASGSSTAVGLQSSIVTTNGQIAACGDPGRSCTAANSNNLSIRMSDLPYNPATNSDGSARGSGHNGKSTDGFGPGGTQANSGFTGVNATPPPTPTTASSSGDDQSGLDEGTGGSGGSGGSGGATTRRHYFETNAVASQLAVNGHIVLIDLWDQWPGRRLPPMPNPLKTRVSSSTVDASMTYFPDVDELPLPMPAAADVSGGASGRGVASPTVRRQTGTASLDLAASDGDDVFPPLMLQDVDPWSLWPDAEALPMPLQALPAAVVAEPQTDAAFDTAAPLPPDNGAMPMQFDLAAFLSLLTISLRLAMRHGRELMAVLRSWFNQRRRAYVLLRLAFGMLRLW